MKPWASSIRKQEMAEGGVEPPQLALSSKWWSAQLLEFAKLPHSLPVRSGCALNPTLTLVFPEQALCYHQPAKLRGLTGKNMGSFSQGDAVLTNYHLSPGAGPAVWPTCESSAFPSGQLPGPPPWPHLRRAQPADRAALGCFISSEHPASSPSSSLSGSFLVALMRNLLSS